MPTTKALLLTTRWLRSAGSGRYCVGSQDRGGTLEERVSVLEEVLQEQVMAVREEEKGGD